MISGSTEEFLQLLLVDAMVHGHFQTIKFPTSFGCLIKWTGFAFCPFEFLLKLLFHLFEVVNQWLQPASSRAATLLEVAPHKDGSP